MIINKLMLYAAILMVQLFSMTAMGKEFICNDNMKSYYGRYKILSFVEYGRVTTAKPDSESVLNREIVIGDNELTTMYGNTISEVNYQIHCIDQKSPKYKFHNDAKRISFYKEKPPKVFRILLVLDKERRKVTSFELYEDEIWLLLDGWIYKLKKI